MPGVPADVPAVSAVCGQEKNIRWIVTGLDERNYGVTRRRAFDADKERRF